jgi:Tfp pilus assembly PilM family ATPase
LDILGIDVGTITVKYVRWKGKRGKGTFVSKGDYSYRGTWKDLEEILSDIRNREGTNVDVSVGLTAQEILKRTFTMPVLPKEEMREAARWSASKLIGTPLEEMVYEIVPLGEIDERGVRKSEMLFVGGTKEYIGTLLSVFEIVGFTRVQAVSDAGLACLPFVAQKVKESFAVVDIGGRQTGIFVFGGGKLKFLREIMTASESFSDALMSGRGLSYEEAEAYKRDKGFDANAQSVLAPPLDRFVGEIQRTLSVYRLKHPEDAVDNIYLTGRASKIPHFLERLQAVFSESIEYLRTGIDLENEFLLASFLCRYKNSLINILPEQNKERERQRTYGRWVRIGTVAVMSVLVVFSMGLVHKLRKLDSLLALEKNGVLKRKGQVESLGADVGGQKYSEILSLKEELDKKDVTFVILLRYLSSNLSNKVVIREIDFDRQEKLEARADALSREIPKDQGKGGGGREGEKNLQETVKGAITESVAGGGTVAAQAKEGAKELLGGSYALMLKGLIFDEEDMLEPAFLEMTLLLEKSGMLKDIQVIRRQVTEIRGRKALEFAIMGKCSRYEV